MNCTKCEIELTHVEGITDVCQNDNACQGRQIEQSHVHECYSCGGGFYHKGTEHCGKGMECSQTGLTCKVKI